MGNRRGFDARRGGRGAGMETLVRMAGWFWLRLSLVRRSPRAGQPSRLVEIAARAMKPVFEKLEILDIPAAGNSANVEPADFVSHDVIDRIIRRAEELRRNWSKTNGVGGRSSARVSAAAAV